LHLHLTSLPFSAFDYLPGREDILHVRKIHSPLPTDAEQQPSSLKKSPPVLICNGIPSVPARLVKRVKEGLFIEISELLPDHLSSAELNFSGHSTSSKPKLSEVNNIMDWIECFGI